MRQTMHDGGSEYHATAELVEWLLAEVRDHVTDSSTDADPAPGRRSAPFRRAGRSPGL
ncbi:hypothetical protein [Streptomyces beigongshangae]|uniref:hypothetical protein n=1 Tax=Streptomyces beigongshangae TaxID=2841597 RepID=UPI001C8583F4|nr:hypothetical protein [Streptomyces sp. REN17]